MWVSRILLIIVITALGEASRAEPHRREMPGYPCGDQCYVTFYTVTPELKPGMEFCRAVLDLVACIRNSCTKENELERVDMEVYSYRNLFQIFYPPCVKDLQLSRKYQWEKS